MEGRGQNKRKATTDAKTAPAAKKIKIEASPLAAELMSELAGAYIFFQPSNNFYFKNSTDSIDLLFLDRDIRAACEKLKTIEHQFRFRASLFDPDKPGKPAQPLDNPFHKSYFQGSVYAAISIFEDIIHELNSNFQESYKPNENWTYDEAYLYEERMKLLYTGMTQEEYIEKDKQSALEEKKEDTNKYEFIRKRASLIELFMRNCIDLCNLAKDVEFSKEFLRSKPILEKKVQGGEPGKAWLYSLVQILEPIAAKINGRAKFSLFNEIDAIQFLINSYATPKPTPVFQQNFERNLLDDKVIERLNKESTELEKLCKRILSTESKSNEPNQHKEFLDELIKNLSKSTKYNMDAILNSIDSYLTSLPNNLRNPLSLNLFFALVHKKITDYSLFILSDFIADGFFIKLKTKVESLILPKKISKFSLLAQSESSKDKDGDEKMNSKAPAKSSLRI